MRLSSPFKKSLLAHARLPLVLLGGVLVVGCVVATKPLWRLDQAASGCSHPFNTFVNGAGDIYQVCSSSGDADGWIRKLSSDAVEQWRQPIDFHTQGGKISNADDSVILFHDNNQLTWINADGTRRWNREVVPEGSSILAHSRVADGRLYLAYAGTLSRLIEGVVAVDASGSELWRHRFNAAGEIYTRPGVAVLDSGELMVKLTRGDQDRMDVAGELYVFDVAGNQVQQRTVAKYAQLIDNQSSAYLIEHYTISKLDAAGASQWSHAFAPWDDSLFEYPMYIPCDGDGVQEIACGFDNAITWLAEDGSVVNRYGVTDVREISYNGNDKWVVTRRTERTVPSVLTQKTETFNSLFVMTNQGTIEQKIYLNPSEETRYFCNENPFTFTCTKVTNGDAVMDTYATSDRIFAVGYTTYPAQSFISAFSLAAP